MRKHTTRLSCGRCGRFIALSSSVERRAVRWLWLVWAYVGALSVPKLKQLRTALVVAFDMDDNPDAESLDLAWEAPLKITCKHVIRAPVAGELCNIGTEGRLLAASREISQL